MALRRGDRPFEVERTFTGFVNEYEDFDFVLSLFFFFSNIRNTRDRISDIRVPAVHS